MSHLPPTADGSVSRSATRVPSQDGASHSYEFAGLAPLYAGVLVGGQSLRMGRSKALLAFQGSSLLERIIAAVQTRVRAVYLLGDGAVPPLLSSLDRIADVPDVAGPMAGMLAAMRRIPHACWLFVACDMPLVLPQALDWLIGQRTRDHCAVLPRIRSEGVEPLLALYEPASRVVLEGLAKQGFTSAQRIVEEPSVATPTVPDDLRFAWVNVNTPDELRYLECTVDLPKSFGQVGQCRQSPSTTSRRMPGRPG